MSGLPLTEREMFLLSVTLTPVSIKYRNALKRNAARWDAPAGRFVRYHARKALPASVEELVQHKNRFLIHKLEEELICVFGIEETIAGVSSLPLKRALASSSFRIVVNTVLEGLGLSDWFDTSVAGDEVEKAKPDPAIFRRTADGLGVDPRECVVIEDSKRGIIRSVALFVASAGSLLTFPHVRSTC